MWFIKFMGKICICGNKNKSDLKIVKMNFLIPVNKNIIQAIINIISIIPQYSINYHHFYEKTCIT